MCVFSLATSIITNEILLIPLDPYQTDSIYNMLANAFPDPIYSPSPFDPLFNDGYICCAGGYENAIAFWRN